MITIQEIKAALEDAGAVIQKRVLRKSDNFQEFWFIHFGYSYFGRQVYAGKCSLLLEELLRWINDGGQYFFKKQHVEYGTIDYGINELIEDLRSWL